MYFENFKNFGRYSINLKLCKFTYRPITIDKRKTMTLQPSPDKKKTIKLEQVNRKFKKKKKSYSDRECINLKHEVQNCALAL